MLIQIRTNGQHREDELRSLYTWLRDEPEVRHHAHTSLVAKEAQVGEMGATLEILQLVTDSGFQALNLALAYAAWKDSRSSHPQVTIECNGIKITLNTNSKDAVDEIVKVLK